MLRYILAPNIIRFEFEASVSLRQNYCCENHCLRQNGFQFFKRSVAGRSTDSNETALKAIEQEMLTVRQRYIDGHILKDVYVAETRRLYDRAKALNS